MNYHDRDIIHPNLVIIDTNIVIQPITNSIEPIQYNSYQDYNLGLRGIGHLRQIILIHHEIT